MKRLATLLVVLALTAATASADSLVLKGTVKDQNGRTLPNVVVYVYQAFQFYNYDNYRQTRNIDAFLDCYSNTSEDVGCIDKFGGYPNTHPVVTHSDGTFEFGGGHNDYHYDWLSYEDTVVVVYSGSGMGVCTLRVNNPDHRQDRNGTGTCNVTVYPYRTNKLW
jgi:hypothetical protein